MSVCLSAFFLSNHGSGGHQMWICGYVQRALATARVWSGVKLSKNSMFMGRAYTVCTSRKIFMLLIPKGQSKTLE